MGNAGERVYDAQREQGRLADAGAFPKVILLDTVSYCNLRCSMCVHRSMTRPKGFMAWGLFTKLVDEIAAERPDARVWMVFFGEALIRKRVAPTIFDMIAYAKERGLTDVVLNTNAALLDEAAARGLIRAGLDALYVGIDAATPETYARVRVGAEHAVTVANVLRLLRLKRELGAACPAVFVQFVEMDENRAEKEAFIDFWRQHEVTVKIRPKVSWAGQIEAPNLVLGNAERWPCHWAMQTMSVAHDGRVVTCPVDLDARFVAGDATRESLKAIWCGRLRGLRELHLARRFEDLPPVCRDCRDWQSARADYHVAAEQP
ncbi:MAG TPA: radical SAM protein [Candidatus Methanoperedens sp.]|nr:radical SAM protein [Candidatus Methanoperedens sp.]